MPTDNRAADLLRTEYLRGLITWDDPTEKGAAEARLELAELTTEELVDKVMFYREMVWLTQMERNRLRAVVKQVQEAVKRHYYLAPSPPDGRGGVT